MTATALQEFTADSLRTEVDSAGVPVLVDFWAPWCGKCMLLAPAVSEVAQEHAGLLRAGKVDVSAFPEIAESFDVQSLPTLVLIKDGSEVLRLTGFKGKAALAAAFAPHLEARTNPS